MTDRTDDNPRPQTVTSAYGVASDPTFGAVAPPLYLSSTYEFAGYDEPRVYDYGRAGNPNRELLSDALSKLERGAGAVITSSGMSALDLLVGRRRPDDLILAPHDCYGGTMRLLKARADLGHCSVRFVNQSEMSAFETALEEVPALVLIETPSNPLMRVVDIAALSRKARSAGATVAVDNTFLSPAIQRPIELGADYVIHSTTKYLNGHSDVIGGAIVAADPAQVEQLRHWANVVGCAGAPFDSWLTLRGLRTLFPRMEQQQVNAMAVAQFLENHPAVAKVHYPGLPTHPSHAIASRQQRGFGAMLSFELHGGVLSVRRFLSAVRFFTLAESLGGVESLVAHPATMTHADMGEDARATAGITDSLLRLSVGLEAERDLLAGLDEGLAACSG
ncbi:MULTISPECIES: cystathionine gamma-synthase [Sphingobium]|uniref:Cystathionine gamma-synthase n=1 Tax=Sphingobium agri TaxID=2933566 RepID=A0ABT0E1M8_9SPHN|nr:MULTISPECIES: cystathionine gamma-synthase [Sphingobium]MCK0533284.1 cystathionine gamma-synthase [Sphingobium agri]QPI73323.1 cystathionine gamma-synthase [Sphingobium sp. Cam5-1]